MSFIAILNPDHIPDIVRYFCVPAMKKIACKNKLTNQSSRLCLLLPHPQPDALERDDARLVLSTEYCSAIHTVKKDVGIRWL